MPSYLVFAVIGKLDSHMIQRLGFGGGDIGYKSVRIVNQRTITAELRQRLDRKCLGRVLITFLIELRGVTNL